MSLNISKIPPNLDQIAHICNAAAVQLQQCAQLCRQLSRQIQQVPKNSQWPTGGRTYQSINTNFAPSDIDLFGEITPEDP